MEDLTTGIYRLYNNTHGTISEVRSTCNGGAVINLKSLERGKHSPEQEIVVGAGLEPHTEWFFSFVNHVGHTVSGKKECSYTPDDSGHVCTIHFNHTDFDVLTPKSSGCTGVSYN